MSDLFKRAWKVTVFDLLLEGIDLDFRIDRSLDVTQNTSDLNVYNLSEDNRNRVQAHTPVPVEIKAGYENEDDPTEEPPLIFRGTIREVTSIREEADWITKISSGDGDEAKKSPVSFSLGPGSEFESAVKKVIDGMGVGVGNAVKAIKERRFEDASTQFANGLVVHGNAGDELHRLLDSADMEYSIQNEELQVLPKGSALNTTAVLLNIHTGLIGSPERGERKKNKFVKFRSLMNAQIFPGRKVNIVSESFEGFYRVNRAVYVGQTYSTDWYVDCEATEL